MRALGWRRVRAARVRFSALAQVLLKSQPRAGVLIPLDARSGLFQWASLRRLKLTQFNPRLFVMIPETVREIGMRDQLIASFVVQRCPELASL